MYPDTAMSYTDVDDVNLVPSACQWQAGTVAADKLRLVELSVFVETDRPMSEQVVAQTLFHAFSTLTLLVGRRERHPACI